MTIAHRTRDPRVRAAAFALAAIALLTGCTLPGSPSPTPTIVPDTVVDISAFEYGYTLSETEISAGTVEFRLTNDGEMFHDVVLEGGPGGSTPVIASEETAFFTARLESGTYTLFCSIGNHRALGMEIEITVR